MSRLSPKAPYTAAQLEGAPADWLTAYEAAYEIPTCEYRDEHGPCNQEAEYKAQRLWLGSMYVRPKHANTLIDTHNSGAGPQLNSLMPLEEA